MIIKFNLIIPVILVLPSSCYESSFKDLFDGIKPALRPVQLLFEKVFGQSSFGEYNIERVQRINKLQKQFNNSVPFPCPLNDTRSLTKPVSVHKLRPGDIDVIGALGDSLSAGYGLLAADLFSVFTIENRGIAFSAGGQSNWRKFLTLPNILKEFNPDLYGYSIQNSLVTDKESYLNVAEGGSVSANTPDMARELVKRMKQDPRVDWKRDWKMITYHIGGNDFCLETCRSGKLETKLKRHREDLIDVLRTLRNNLPRTFVNIIPAPNINVLARFRKVPNICEYTHRIECPCIFSENFKNFQPFLSEFMNKWQKIDYEIANMDEFDTEDFTLVLQPFIMDYTMSDVTILSADCFHLSQKGNAEVANSLWNNLLEPVERKSRQRTRLFNSFHCPTREHPYLFTRRNSRNLI